MAKRRPRYAADDADAEPIVLNQPCSICGTRESAVKARRSSKPLCVLHYFTTTAPHRRNNATPHTILSSSIVAEQTAETQDIFSTAFLELQQEIQKQQDLATAKQQDQQRAPQAVAAGDPLSILSRWHSGKKKAPESNVFPIQKKKNRKQPPSTCNEGGFLRPVPVPADIVRTQQAQMNKQHVLTQRITGSPQQQYKKKKTPKSVWHVNPYDVPRAAALDVPSLAASAGAQPKCGSCRAATEVVVIRTTQRKQDMGVAETWSNKDRDDDVVTTYQCHGCGSIWTEQE